MREDLLRLDGAAQIIDRARDSFSEEEEAVLAAVGFQLKRAKGSIRRTVTDKTQAAVRCMALMEAVSYEMLNGLTED